MHVSSALRQAVGQPARYSSYQGRQASHNNASSSSTCWIMQHCNTSDRCPAVHAVAYNAAEESVPRQAGKPIQIKVVGLGGGGGNAVNRMVQKNVQVSARGSVGLHVQLLRPQMACLTCCQLLQGVELWAVNTDAQALEASSCPNKLAIGTQLTGGLGGQALL